MSVPFSTVVTGVISVSVLHALVPHHWLPFVLIGRREGWDRKRTLGVLALGAVAHMVSTMTVALIVGFLGRQIDQRFEALHGVVPAMVLFAFGGGFFLSSFGHFHSEVSEKVKASS